MKRSDRLKQVAGHMSEERDVASRKLVELRAEMDQAEQQLQGLKQYLASYQAELEQIQQEGVSSARLQNYTAFLGQLHEALQQQERKTRNARLMFERQMDVWYQARTHVRAVEKAADRRAVVELHSADKSEQRLQDDLSLYRLAAAKR
ncbi:flagellar export protein FliJ [Kineobactrum sediminis]|uniref:Flagellar FliJ protein n=1 Tax=Kineobactrum sediminis TaxID=1905677 RepID=A0A2N5Y6G9_9GAMM|nr:flagellar export protein FliJ [Kineobactrum sediminis]PLW83971.1 flagellar export protein FliJ [Kineobactrum sediminis]